ncbi:DNA replication complex GINS protein PSF2 [Lachancea thermotolerans]|uniref:DNA replication complex GINS protein PSF2 n=1 Tax=Lachancea thermotolerans (strain ATCC 56472 / CBS 6340 / NRRL Y-8284) TaxID=559295 RepID=C5E340_LACTC|nr:KLTH0H10164p [Lachancea thermotolerans CBS 6340]CAR30451.1 KLTH0H10164p [Lachancea thermotolerans CBS 6340]
MSLPWNIQETFSPEEIQFIVENEPIKIFPRFTTRVSLRGDRAKPAHTRWKLVTADDHPLNNLVAIQTTEVALWMALLLKQQGKCSIVAPGWLRLSQLQKYIDYELKHAERFSELPWNWLVVAQLLFSKAADDLHDPVHLLRGKIQDLREIRLGKIGQGLKHLNESHLQLDNLSLLEINELRPFVLGVMNKLKQVHSSISEERGSEDYYE